MSEINPGDLAREFAARFPDASGELNIEAFRPKGKGGRRGVMRSSLVYYFAGGKAAMTRGTSRDEKGGRGGVTRRNGRCRVCGRTFVKPVLVDGYAPDALAGGDLPPSQLKLHSYSPWEGYRYVYGEKSSVQACPDCVAERGLEVTAKFRPYERTDTEGKVITVEGCHNGLTFYPGPNALVKIDLTRAVEEGFDYLHKCPWCDKWVSALRGRPAYCPRCHHRADATKANCDCDDASHRLTEKDWELVHEQQGQLARELLPGGASRE